MAIKSTPKEGNVVFRFIRARARLMISIVIGVAVALLFQVSFAQEQVTHAVIGWNAGALIYIIFTFRMMFGSSHDKIQRRAAAQDEGRMVILILVIVAAVVTLGSIINELALAKKIQSPERFAHVALAALTIVTSWLFTHIMFALHYAHDFYVARSHGGLGGLQFPATEQPDYLDFLYFSCIIGTSAQTADISFTSKPMRRTGLVHCVLAFFFNTTLLALTINIASGLF